MSCLSLRIAVCAALALACACVSTSEQIQPTAVRSTLSSTLAWDELTLGPGDVVRVGVYGHPELSAPPNVNTAAGSRIDGEGNLSLPLVGAVHVGGMKMSDAHTAITAAFAKYVQDPRIDATVMEYAARRFYLFGEVQKPGPYVLDRPLSIYQALSFGEGFTTKANRGDVVLLRGGPDDLEVHRFSAEVPTAGGLFAIRPDDIVFVRRTSPGKFSDEILPYLSGISSSLTSIATVLLIDDQLKN
jgi:protein involved in polysaccharide export with SLBB domain